MRRKASLMTEEPEPEEPVTAIMGNLADMGILLGGVFVAGGTIVHCLGGFFQGTRRGKGGRIGQGNPAFELRILYIATLPPPPVSLPYRFAPPATGI
jgi:hypothetical protein